MEANMHIAVYVVLITMIVFLYISVQNGKKKLRDAKNELSYVNFITSNLSIPWCLWNTKRTTVECSKSFSEVFGFDEQLSLTMEDVFKKLNAGAFSPLAKAINHLLEFGGLFNLQITIDDTQKEIKIYGKIVTFVTEFGPIEIVILTLYDVTQNFEIENNAKNLIQHLKSENEMLNYIINESPFAVWHRNLQGAITFCNTAYAGAMGSSVSKIIAENLELIPTNQCNLFELSRQALLHSEKMTTRVHTVIDGHRRLLEISELPMKDSGTTIGYAMDITEIEDLEKQIKKTTRSYRDILDALSTPIAVFDESKHLSFNNLAYQQLFEFSDHILAKKPTLGELLDDLRKRRKIQEYNSFQEHKRERNQLFNDLLSPIEEVSYLPDGRTLRIRISPYPLGGILFIFENLTNQLDLERDVHTLQAVQKTTLDHLREGILVIGSDGLVRLYNPSIKSIWKVDDVLEKESLHVQNLFQEIEKSFMDKEQHMIWQQQLFKRFSERHPVMEKLFLKDNQVVEWFYVPLPDGSHMLGFIDVSDVFHHEQQLKARNLTLEMTQKLKAEYLDEINAEIKTPLSDIIGFSNTLNQQIFGSLNEKQIDYCKLIFEKAKDVETLFENVFDLIRIDFDHIDIQDEEINIEEFFDTFQTLVLKKANDLAIECEIECNIKKHLFKGDFKRLQQAFLGLTMDAFKKVPKNGSVHIIIKDENNTISFQIRHMVSQRSRFTDSIYLGKKIANIILSHHNGHIDEKKMDQEQIVECSLPLAS